MIRGSSIRSQRANRRFAASRRNPALNLVSLMDIFTILVFFLMVNSAQMEVLPNATALTLPDSISTDKPNEHVLVLITRDDVQVNGRSVMTLDAVSEASDPTAAHPLKTELMQSPLRPVVGGEPGQLSRGEVNIMADRDTPFQLLRRIMSLCTEANFSRISLAVVSQAPASTTGAAE